MKTIRDLIQQNPLPGRVVSLCYRPARLASVIFVDEIDAVANQGLSGDRYQSTGNRQVTLIQKEDLMAVSSYLHREITHAMVRRNILVEGINLLALKGRQFMVGDTLLAYSGECHPCSRMETNLGTGGYNAMRGHGGITAKILSGGKIRVNDSVLIS